MSSKTPEESKLGHGNQKLTIEHARAFMTILNASKLHHGSNKNERASMETPFFH